MGTQRITGTIEGIAPILFSRFYTDIEAGAQGKPKVEMQKLEAGLKCHKDERGIYIPRGMFKQAILAGAKAGGIKKGKATYATTLEAVLFAEDHLYLKGKTTYDEEFLHWGRRPPRTGGAMMIRYPQFHIGWQADFSLVLMFDFGKTADAVHESIVAAGLLVGMGSWRPEYGRFMLLEDNWRVEAVDLATPKAKPA